MRRQKYPKHPTSDKESDRSDSLSPPDHDAAQRLDDQRLVRTILRRADVAGQEIIPFFNFVVREERSQRRITAAAHQRLYFQFVRDHKQSVVRMPVGTGKTFSSGTIILHELGRDHTTRWALISASQSQAAKPFSMVQDYVENAEATYPELGLVFPALRPSLRRKDPWTQTKLTVDRPPGIRDPSLVAIGVDGALPGARLAGVVVDDVLDIANTSTPAARQKTLALFDSTVLSRRDVEASQVVVTNTPWHPEDLTYVLEKRGWATLTMSITGEVTIANADTCDSKDCGWNGDCPADGKCPRCGAHVTIWDSEEIRPSELGRPDMRRYRLSAHDSVAYGAPLCGWQFRRGKPPERVQLKESDRSDSFQKRVSSEPGQPSGGTAPCGRPADPSSRLRTETGHEGAKPSCPTPVSGVEQLHYFDIDEEIPLWPERYSTPKIQRLKWEYRNNQAAYNQLYLCQVRDDATAKCKEEWITRCKRLAFLAGFTHLAHEHRGSNVVVTGVDLAMGQGEEHDYTSLFTFEVIPNLTILIPAGEPAPLGNRIDHQLVLRNVRRVLDVDFGRWRGRTVVDKIIDKARRFGSIVRVETNAAQDFLRQWTLDADISVPVRAHHTGANKSARITGVEGVFIELENGAWLLPSEADGTVSPGIAQAIDDCLNYKPPPAHTGDVLMSWWLARAQARALDAGEPDGASGSLSMGLMAR